MREVLSLQMLPIAGVDIDCASDVSCDSGVSCESGNSCLSTQSHAVTNVQY